MPIYKKNIYISTVWQSTRNKKFIKEILNDTIHSSFKNYQIRNHNEILLHIGI